MKIWICYIVGALFVGFALLPACTQDSTVRGGSLPDSTKAAGSEPSRTSTDCKVAAGSPTFRQAICAHDTQLIREALFGLRDDERTYAIGVLHKIWIESDEAGESLPWVELRRTEFRLAYAPALVQSVRDGSDSLPLKPFQDLALEAATKNTGSLEEIEAIRLLGLANA